MLRESSSSTPTKVLLRDRGLDHQQRPEHADEEDAKDREPDRRQDDAIARPAAPVARPIRDDRQPGRHRNRRRRDVRAGRGREPEFPLTENHRGQFKESSKEGVEHEFLGFYFYL